MGPPLPESLPGLGVLTLVPRVLGSSLPQEILHQAVIAFHAFVSPSLAVSPWRQVRPPTAVSLSICPEPRHGGGAQSRDSRDVVQAL